MEEWDEYGHPKKSSDAPAILDRHISRRRDWKGLDRELSRIEEKLRKLKADIKGWKTRVTKK